MSFEILLYVGFGIASLFFAIATLAALAWAFLGRRGESRKRRLRIAFSAALLFIAAALSSISAYHFLVWPTLMPIQQPDFKPPYDWQRETAAILAPCFIVASVVSIIWAQRQSPAKRTNALLASLSCLLLFVAATVVNYVVFYRVQIPAFDRYVMIERSGKWLTHVGDPVPDVTVTMLDGSHVRLSELRGKVVLMNFFATWCGPCLSELPHLEQIWKEREANPNFRMLVIGRKETPETAAPFKAKNGFTFPMAVDADASAFRQFAEDLIPRTYLISRDGRILFQTHGFAEIEVYQRELALLRQSIDKELAGPQ
jgi:peroxiredoxin